LLLRRQGIADLFYACDDAADAFGENRFAIFKVPECIIIHTRCSTKALFEYIKVI